MNKPCGLVRRLAAAFYDALLVIALLIFATALLLPITHGQAIEVANGYYRLYLLLIAFCYYAWCWTHGGQTVGMRAWRVRVCKPSGESIGLDQALIRFLAAPLSLAALGLGFAWSLFDRRGRTWHDLLSASILVVLPRRR